MSTTIKEINCRWISYLPTDAANVSVNQVGAESQLRWGVPVTYKPGLGLAGSAPPQAAHGLQSPFTLATLRHFNYITLTTGITSATAEVEVVFANLDTVKFELTFDVEETPNDLGSPASNDIITLRGGVPATISAGGLELQLTAFGSGGEFSSPENSDNSAAVTASLLSTPQEESHCVPGEFVPVFAPDKCELPPICPISEEPIIADCSIPEAPEPITDCPEIDIPIGIGTTLPGDGPPGPPGPPGAPGCNPLITVSSSVVYYEHCQAPTVSVVPLIVETCRLHLHFTFYLCAPVYYQYDCCWYVCCDGTWTLLDGGYHCYLHGATTTTTSHPGSPPPVIGPPDGPCDYPGHAVMICPCDSYPADCVTVYCCGGNLESVADVSVTFSPACPRPCHFDTKAVYNDATSIWEAVASDCDDTFVRLHCSESGQWHMTLSCRGQAVEATEVSCTFSEVLDNVWLITGLFDASAIGEDPGSCCFGASSSDSVIATFAIHSCTSGSTPPPPDCVDVDCAPCSSMPGTLSLGVTDGAVSWPASAWYDSATGCWGATSTSDSSQSLSICCEGGSWVLTWSSNAGDDSVAATATAGTPCSITGTIVGAGTITLTGTDCGLVDADCIELSCTSGVCGNLSTEPAEVSISGGDCCLFNGTAEYSTATGRWEAFSLDCDDGSARVYLWCDSGAWKITIECDGDTETMAAGEAATDTNCFFSAVFDSNTLPGCCAGASVGDVAVQFVLKRCCTDADRLCEWVYDLDAALWVLVTENNCAECGPCVTPPAAPGFDGEIRYVECE